MPEDFSSLHRKLLSYWKFDNGQGWQSDPGAIIPSPAQWDYGKYRRHIYHTGFSTERLFGNIIVPGKLGGCIRPNEGGGASHITAFADYLAAPLAPPFTFGGWFKFTRQGAGPFPAGFYPFFGWQKQNLQWLANSTVRLNYGSAAGPNGFVDSAVLTHDEWHLIIGSISEDWVFRLRIDNGAPVVALNLGDTTPDDVSRVELRCLWNYVDDSFIYNRLLNEEEEEQLWNDGAGLSIDDFIEQAASDCQAIPCCEENPFAYMAVPEISTCATSPITLSFYPPPGACVAFPSLVSITASSPEAVIYYTLDGSDPTELSTLYVVPFQVNSPQTVIRSKAYVDGCAPSETHSTQYVLCEPSLIFAFRCVDPGDDFVGPWGDFTPNGQQDYRWTLDMTLASALAVKSITIYQTNSEGVWDTGQAWSTQQFNSPPEGPVNFNTYPLGVFDPAQLNNAYSADFSTSFGNFAPGAHTIELYGETQAPLSGYFRFELALADGTIYQLSDSAICDPPPPCIPPEAPSLVATCESITVTFSSTIGAAYSILRTSSCGSPFAATLDYGEVTSVPQSFVDTQVTPDCEYCYWMEITLAGCPSIAGPKVCAHIIHEPVVTISAEHLNVCEGTDVLISWSSNNIAAGGACAAGTVNISPTIGVQPGNAAGSQVVNITATTTFTITGCNFCDIASSQVTVTVDQDCSRDFPSVRIQDYNEQTGFRFVCTTPPVGAVVPWSEWGFNGVMNAYTAGIQCDYFAIFGSPGFQVGFRVFFEQADCRWVFQIYDSCGGVFSPIFTAYNANGLPGDPRGTYVPSGDGATCLYCTNPGGIGSFTTSGALVIV